MAIRFPSFSEVGDKVALAARRFPMAMLAAVAGVCVLYYLIEMESHHVPGLGERLGRIALICSLGLPLFVGLAVFSEKNAHPPILKWGLQLLGLPVLAFAWWAIDPGNDFREMHSLVWFVGLSFLFHIFVSFAAYLKKADSVLDFWEFNKQLFINFLAGALYSGIILAGLAIAIVAADQLFHIHFGGKIWGYLFTTVLGLFQTVYFLSNFPADFEFDHSEIRFETIVKNLVKWILIPIVGLYFLILYAYSGKILATWQLPIGWVSSLMVGFSVAGIFTWLMNFMLPRLDGSGIISFFKKWFWPILSPMLVLLFVAIWRRMHEYGLTEDRYLIAHLGVWLSVMAAYFIFSKKDDIRAIPVSLAVFTIIYLMPGVGGIDAGIRSQTKILTQLLEKNGLLKDGKAVPQSGLFKGEDAFRMNDLLGFLAQRDAMAPVAAWTGKAADEFKKDPSRYSASNEMAVALGISEHYNTGSPNYQGIYRSNTNPLAALPVAGFDSLHQVEMQRGHIDSGQRAWIEEDGHSLYFDENAMEIQPILDDLWKKQMEGRPTLDSLGQIELVGKTRSARFILNNAGLNKTDEKVRIESAGGWLLTKKN